MNKDKIRLYFTWREKLYEKWIEIDYPNNILDNSEHKQAFIFDFIKKEALQKLKDYYKETIGEEYPNTTTKIREIVVNKNIKAEDIIKKLDSL